MDILGRIIIFLVCLASVVLAVRRYKAQKKFWFLLATITASLASIAALLGAVANAIFLAVLAAALFLLGGWSIQKK
jgi:hypothetical protein